MLALSFSAAHAITLFPFFGDIAGDFEDGTTEKFVELNIPTICWRASPFWYKDIKSANDFLQEVLPFSSYEILQEEKDLPDGTKIIIYSSSLEADGLNKGKWSKLILVQTPGEQLYAGLYEDQL